MMSKDLAYYRLLPYEREWAMREEAGQRYFVVRLKDVPAVAGDGFTRDEAVDDLREAFDEFVSAWIEAGYSVPEPKRPFTLPSMSAQPNVDEWPVTLLESQADARASTNRADSAVVYSNDVRATSAEPPWELKIAAVS
jgi:predicted RNase H-like HicB family nuclease